MKGALCITPEFLDREVKGEESKVTKEIEGGKQNGRIKKKRGIGQCAMKLSYSKCGKLPKCYMI